MMTPPAGHDDDSFSLKNGSTDSATIAAYYDDWAATYDDTLQDWKYRAPHEAAQTLVPHLKPGAAVLDVGCGTGLFGAALAAALPASFKRRLDGLDISAASLEIAGQSGHYRRLRRCDLQALPLALADNAYDAAASIGVMTYIDAAADLLADLCRIVRPGGHILFTQRDDRWREKNFDALIAGLEARKLWSPIAISQAKPYLPGNEDFGDAIRVIQVHCQVT
jgi:predicted TPR repeat methyltransferase